MYSTMTRNVVIDVFNSDMLKVDLEEGCIFILMIYASLIRFTENTCMSRKYGG